MRRLFHQNVHKRFEAILENFGKRLCTHLHVLVKTVTGPTDREKILSQKKSFVKKKIIS